jgi:hypothetical protein
MFRNMSTSLFTAEEKRQVRWFVMRAYKNEKMAEDRLKDKEYGLEYFIGVDITLVHANLHIGMYYNGLRSLFS